MDFPALTAIFKALNVYFKIQALSRTFKVSANPEFHCAVVCNATNKSPYICKGIRENFAFEIRNAGLWNPTNDEDITN